ncbi:MAG: hypothetical protein ACE365_07730 [Gammaproteobacteria bacterium]
MEIDERIRFLEEKLESFDSRDEAFEGIQQLLENEPDCFKMDSSELYDDLYKCVIRHLERLNFSYKQLGALALSAIRHRAACLTEAIGDSTHLERLLFDGNDVLKFYDYLLSFDNSEDEGEDEDEDITPVEAQVINNTIASFQINESNAALVALFLMKHLSSINSNNAIKLFSQVVDHFHNRIFNLEYSSEYSPKPITFFSIIMEENFSLFVRTLSDKLKCCENRATDDEAKIADFILTAKKFFQLKLVDCFIDSHIDDDVLKDSWKNMFSRLRDQILQEEQDESKSSETINALPSDVFVHYENEDIIPRDILTSLVLIYDLFDMQNQLGDRFRFLQLNDDLREDLLYMENPLQTIKEPGFSVIENENLYYSFLNIDGDSDCWYPLPNVPQAISDARERRDRIVLSLITRLNYIVFRYPEETDAYKLVRLAINKMDDNFVGYSHERLVGKLFSEEERRNDFFSDNLSDDSDDEQEVEFRRRPQRERFGLAHEAGKLQLLAQSECFYSNRKNEIKLAKKQVYKIHDRHKLDRAFQDREKRDLDRLNALALQNNLNTDSVKSLATNFLIAQFRGIHFSKDKFNQDSRRAYRKNNESGRQIFSESVIKASGQTYDGVLENYEQFEEELRRKAGLLQHVLLCLQESGPLSQPTSASVGNKSSYYRYDQLGDANQDFYTSSYSGFFQRKDDLKKTGITQENLFLLGMSLDGNDYVSMSDFPDHPLRYAFGTKSYSKENKDIFCSPMWDNSGRSQHPYIGKVYVSLHTPMELLAYTNQISRMYQDGSLSIKIHIAQEMETSFLACTPEGRIISELNVKFPSFHKPYPPHYHFKYGIDERMYQAIQYELKNKSPHTEKRKLLENAIIEYLISYHTVALLQEAQQAAKEKGAELVFRNVYGGFSEDPPKLIEKGSKAESDADTEITEYINSQRESRRSTEPLVLDNWLYNFMEDKTLFLREAFLEDTVGMISEVLWQNFINQFQKPLLEFGRFGVHSSVKTSVAHAVFCAISHLATISDENKQRIYIYSHLFKPASSLNKSEQAEALSHERVFVMKPQEVFEEVEEKVEVASSVGGFLSRVMNPDSNSNEPSEGRAAFNPPLHLYYAGANLFYDIEPTSVTKEKRPREEGEEVEFKAESPEKRPRIGMG